MKAKTKFSKTKFSRFLTPILFLLLISTAGCLNIDFVKSAANGGPLAWTYSPAENIVIVPAEPHYRTKGDIAITKDRIYVGGDEQGNAKRLIFVFDHTGKHLVDETIEVKLQHRWDNTGIMRAHNEHIHRILHDGEYIYALVRSSVFHSYYWWFVKIDPNTSEEVNRYRPWHGGDSHSMLGKRHKQFNGFVFHNNVLYICRLDGKLEALDKHTFEPLPHLDVQIHYEPYDVPREDVNWSEREYTTWKNASNADQTHSMDGYIYRGSIFGTHSAFDSDGFHEPALDIILKAEYRGHGNDQTEYFDGKLYHKITPTEIRIWRLQ